MESRSGTHASPPVEIGPYYRVIRELGDGGMARVYLCVDRRDETRAAVKILRFELGSMVVVRRFLREIEVASKLDHPRIPKVLDSGLIDDLPYYGMTFIEGELLRARIERQKQLPIEDAIRIVREIIEPTKYAHDQGIIHRDIKPENVIIAADGVYVLDFGIARAIVESGSDRLTSTGVGIGTPAYMSPEQAMGDHNLDARSDVYSIGCVLYEMIAGIPPFVGPTAQAVISRRFATNAPPMREVRDTVPEWLEAVVSKALARSPSDRFASAEEFDRALAHPELSASRQIAAPQTGFRRWQKVAASVTALGLMSAVLWTSLNTDHAVAGQEAVQSFDFSKARAEFSKAVDSRSGKASSHLWLAQTGMLEGAPPADWKADLGFANAHGGELTDAERDRAAALAAFAAGNVGDACAKFEKLASDARRSGGADPSASLAVADCAVADKAVVPDAASPSGFRFRGSYALADSIYGELIDAAATSPSVFRTVVPRLEKVLAVDKGKLRPGLSETKPRAAFLALPKLSGDSLVYVPYPLQSAGKPWRTRDAQGLANALARNRARLRDYDTKWVRVAPDDPAAHESFSRTLEANGELDGGITSALSEIRKARAYLAQARNADSTAVVQRLVYANDQLRLHLRLGQFKLVSQLADSVLGWNLQNTAPESVKDSVNDLLTNSAALRGKGFEVIALGQRFAAKMSYRGPDGQMRQIPPSLGSDVIALYAYAAFGAADSAKAVLERINQKISALSSPTEAPSFRRAVLTRPLMMAITSVGPAAVSGLDGSSDLIVRAAQALGRGNRSDARSLLDSIQALHADYAPGELTMDAVLPEAWLRLSLGDTAKAVGLLDNSLNGLSAAVYTILKDSNLSASLIRVMAMRCEIAASRGDMITAAKWRSAVRDLWSDGDGSTALTRAQVEKSLKGSQ